MSKLMKYLFFTGFVYIFQLTNAQNVRDPVPFNSSGLELSDIKFLLYTDKNHDSAQIINIDDKDSVFNSNYDVHKPTKFMIHGWMNDANSECAKPVRQGFLMHNANVVVVEWKRIAASKDYEDVASRVQPIAKVVAKMIDFLIGYGAKESDMTVAGHSMGAHIAGLAAYFSKNIIPHVVAIDPAKPGFTKHGKKGRVHVSDAELVETIHTDTQLLGFPTVIGRIDYFPNGGEFQPGCQNSDKQKANFCAHIRACHFYGESMIRSDKWLARRCDSYESFKNGECDNNQIVRFATYTHRVNRPDGTYYLRTKDKPDKSGYGLGGDGI